MRSILLFLAIFLSTIPSLAQAQTLAERLAGRILLQVEAHGEAWYVDPVSKQRYFLGHAEDAYALMRAKGLGIRHATLETYRASRFPKALSGRILLDVEQHGEAYYILPTTLQGLYLGTASDAYDIMRRYGLGIRNDQLTFIRIALSSTQTSPSLIPSTPTITTVISDPVEARAFELVNNYRTTKGLAALRWDERIATIAREHSRNMGNGSVDFGHDGFEERANTILQVISSLRIAENVAMNGFDDPAQIAVTGWIKSSGHRVNMENVSYTLSGLGVAVGDDGNTYLTQIFVR